VYESKVTQHLRINQGVYQTNFIKVLPNGQDAPIRGGRGEEKCIKIKGS